MIIPLKLFFWGLGFPKKKIVSIYDFLGDYEPVQEFDERKEQAPIILSNHSSFMDVWYYWMENTSFVSKASNCDYPIIGVLPIAKQSVFLETHCQKGRSQMLNKLYKRLEDSRAKKLPPITMFPEGTYNNGEYCLRFKKGGFNHQHPIKIRASSFRKEGLWTCSWTNMHPFIFFTLMMTVPEIFMEVFEVEEPLDPYWVYKKHGITKDHPEAWKYVMQEVKSIICFMTGFKSTEKGFRDILEYEKRSFRKYDKIGGTFARRNGCESKKNPLAMRASSKVKICSAESTASSNKDSNEEDQDNFSDIDKLKFE